VRVRAAAWGGPRGATNFGAWVRRRVRLAEMPTRAHRNAPACAGEVPAMPSDTVKDSWIARELGLHPGDKIPLEKQIDLAARNEQVVRAALQILTAAEKAEPALTRAIAGTTEKLGGKMIGLRHKIKAAESLERKIATDVVKTGILAEDAAGGISDAVRYTSCFEAEIYTAGVNAVLEELVQNGNKIKRLKNAWIKDIPYKGINVQMIDPEGQVFELQFHTPISFKAKDEDTHHIYEEMRVLDPSSQKWAELNQQQMEIFQKVPRPDGVETIKEV
jgi:hypothetical protein